MELIRSKQTGLPAPKEKAPARPADVVILMDALRPSIEGADSGKEWAAKAPAKKTDVPARPKRKTDQGQIATVKSP